MILVAMELALVVAVGTAAQDGTDTDDGAVIRKDGDEGDAAAADAVDALVVGDAEDGDDVDDVVVVVDNWLAPAEAATVVLFVELIDLSIFCLNFN